MLKKCTKIFNKNAKCSVCFVRVSYFHGHCGNLFVSFALNVYVRERKILTIDLCVTSSFRQVSFNGNRTLWVFMDTLLWWTVSSEYLQHDLLKVMSQTQQTGAVVEFAHCSVPSLTKGVLRILKDFFSRRKMHSSVISSNSQLCSFLQ